jgi:hypothetical protein
MKKLIIPTSCLQLSWRKYSIFKGFLIKKKSFEIRENINTQLGKI